MSLVSVLALVNVSFAYILYSILEYGYDPYSFPFLIYNSYCKAKMCFRHISRLTNLFYGPFHYCKSSELRASLNNLLDDIIMAVNHPQLRQLLMLLSDSRHFVIMRVKTSQLLKLIINLQHVDKVCMQNNVLRK